MNEKIHSQYMQRCLELAKKGQGYAEPNPMVGSVIVHKGKIIGEGYHQQYGGPHAEVNAVNSVKDKSLLKDSTLYVNLEPCAHYGKTPPCSLLIIQNEIPKVVIGCVDTFSKVAGKGIEMMQAKGIEIITGVLEQESRKLNKRFFTFHEEKRPYTILKWAESQDGFIDKKRDAKESAAWITDEVCRTYVHKMRAEEQAILVGTNTALLDNPSLNIRSWSGKDPIRVVLDRTLRLPKDLKLFDGSQKTIVITEKEAESSENMIYETVKFSESIVKTINSVLVKHNIISVIVEGGTQLLQSYLDQNAHDEVHRFVGPVKFKDGVKAPVFQKNPIQVNDMGNSKLYVY